MYTPRLLALVIWISSISAFAQTAAAQSAKPPVHHVVKPVVLSPEEAAMKAMAAVLQSDSTIEASYAWADNLTLRETIKRTKVTTAGCVLSFMLDEDIVRTDKSGSHETISHVMDLKNGVVIAATPALKNYVHSGKPFVQSRSVPTYVVDLNFINPQPRRYDFTGYNAAGSLPEKHDSTAFGLTNFQFSNLGDAVSFRNAANRVIQACGGSANVAPSEPSAPIAMQPAAPSAKETNDFISSKINSSSIFSQGVASFNDGSSAPMRQWLTQTVSFLGTNGCAIRWRIHLKRQQKDNSTGHWDDGQDDDYSSGFALAKDFHAISSRVEEWSPDEQWSSPIYQISMPFGQKGSVTLFASDQVLAGRLQRALTGMGKVCGAKDELY